jgi:hypothetical protein
MLSRNTRKIYGAHVVRSAIGRSHRRPLGGVALSAVAFWLGSYGAANAQVISSFTPGDLVISTVSGTTLDTASPMTLQEFSLGAGGTSATSVGSLVLPQTTNQGGVGNSPISGEYGSASEGILQQSANGQYLTVMGYGVNANTFNNAPLSTYGTAALGQTTSLTGQTVTTVPRVVALIGANGSVDTTTALTGVFNQNNPRSVATVDGKSFYVSGQGVTGDGTGGVFYATLGATTATPINANTTTPSGTSNPAVATETRSVEIYNGQLYVSRDFKVSGTPNDATDIRSLTGPGGTLPTSSTGLTVTRVLPSVNSVNGGNTGSIDLTAGLGNGVNNFKAPLSDPNQTNRIGKFVYLSPEEFFFANSTTMYVADSGQPKNGSTDAAAEGEGGLQKWSLNTTTGVWSLDYDLVAGLGLVNNDSANSATPTAAGVTGLFGLTGEVVGDQVELFATSYGLNELSPSFLYEITDSLSCVDSPNTQGSCSSGELFTTLVSSTPGESIRGVAFAPTPLPASWTFMLIGLAGFGWVTLRRKPNASGLAAA